MNILCANVRENTSYEILTSSGTMYMLHLIAHAPCNLVRMPEVGGKEIEALDIMPTSVDAVYDLELGKKMSFVFHDSSQVQRICRTSRIVSLRII